MHDPREPHLNAMKHVLRYLRGTTDLGLQLFWFTTSQLIAYSNADWASCLAMRRAEAEYRGVANAVAETSWIRNLLRELHTSLFTATLVYCDNASAVYMSANPVQHQRTKHIEIDIHFVLDKVAAGHVRALHVPSRFHLAGALQYLTFTRPDLSYAVQQLCLHMHDPREPHLNAMKHVLRYLRGTTDLGLQLFRFTTSQLIAYSNADWASCLATRRSTFGYCVFLGDNLLTWSSKRQDTFSRSSAEAEYRGVANAVAETSWIHNLLRELHTPLFTATLVYCDNVSAVYMSANPVQHQRTKHIEIDIYFVLDKVAAGHVRALHVPSRFQYVDIFTKGLPYPLFADFRSSLSVCKSLTPTARAY
nr:ribonuclease H-like domain-containing protein [Tanacetum cinerariifolium]